MLTLCMLCGKKNTCENPMQSLWNEQDAASCADELALRVYSSRLLGADPYLVLHGGGNTSVKLRRTNRLGDEEYLLYVKGSGHDLATIGANGFAPVRMEHLLRLAELPQLSDLDMARELRIATVDPDAPAPSVEAILHAILPYPFVDHTHADAIVTITNTPGGAERIRAIYGEKVVVIPYVMPGFDLAKVCAELFPQQANPQTIGMVLLNHGLFTFGATAREAYERHIELVSMAEVYLEQQGVWQLRLREHPAPSMPLRHDRAALRHAISASAGTPLIARFYTDPASMAFVRRPDLSTVSQQGPATPDHIIRTKRLPLVGRDVAAYVEAYRAYFARQSAAHPNGANLTMLDPAPRIALDPELGLCALGNSVQAAAIAGELYQHTIEIITRASDLGGYAALPEADLFAVEYWDLEQAKLKRGARPALFSGEVALVTGAASGIGKACVEALVARGAAVVALDLNPAITTQFKGPAVLGLQCDVSDNTAVEQALEAASERFGGLDMLVLNAGIFPASNKIAALPQQEWTRTMNINLDANLLLLREAHPLLKLAPKGGRVVIIGSKNVPAPGPGAAAYSASKAALTQLARVAALEWGADNIRVNVLHPNAVFDTGIWTEEVLRSRAASYGLSVEQYKTNNILRVEVTSRHVAELAAELCGPTFACTTGAQIPVDGGNERVI
jgi:rhamnose utilization protein RhaD (predicted bifunctional aldolase and dehydrogenase)/NAD(P)-dependent dehydrogenase (short-subunit alcohol dehydrogenase family)